MKRNGWNTEAENTLADEALKLFPALAAARIRGDAEGTKLLFKGYGEHADALRISRADRYSILSVAGVRWMIEYVYAHAIFADVTPAESAQELSLFALEWTERADAQPPS